MSKELNIQMVDLKSQFQEIKEEVNANIQGVIDSCTFINGPIVKTFQTNFEKYLNVKHVIPCANGTDALQIALMASGLEPGDEVIVPAFTYVATAEVIALLGLKPVMIDVDPDTFNITTAIVEKALTSMTKAVVPVHLYGQSAEMEGLMNLAEKHGFIVIEDNAQAIGADYIKSDGCSHKTGTIGHIGCTSFYPSKNLGAYGDGGAIYTNDDELGEKLRIIANHGQTVRYYHDVIGCNSRLDSFQAAVLDPKLKRLDQYCTARQKVADYYDKAFNSVDHLETPARAPHSTHVFHQYTLKVKDGRRNELQEHLKSLGVPSMIYYPVPLFKQKAFSAFSNGITSLPVTEQLCKEVISLPIHTEMVDSQLTYIVESVIKFFR